jgi:hypothetical protein
MEEFNPLPSNNLNDDETKLAMSVSRRMSIVDQVLLILLCDEVKKQQQDVTEVLYYLDCIGLDEGELNVLYKKCCQENFDQVRIVLYAWARGEISTSALKNKIKSKEEMHTICKTIF